MPENRIHVCYALTDLRGTFSKFAGTSICSILENTDASIVIHLLHDTTLSEKNKQKFSQLVARYGQKLCFYDMDQLKKSQIQEIIKAVPDVVKSKWTIAAFYRLLVAQTLPVEIQKIIYLDCDTVINFDLRELWDEALNGKALAAVMENALSDGRQEAYLCQQGIIPPDTYFNSGVLLLSLQALRQDWQDLLRRGLQMLQKYPGCQYYDQDILNYFFAVDYQQLPVRYNTFVAYERLIPDITLGQKLYHYASRFLAPVREDPFNQMFFQYLVKTPWCDAELLFNIFDLEQRIYCNKLVEYRRNLVLAMRKNQLFLWGPAALEGSLRKIFQCQETDGYIPSDQGQGGQQLVAVLERKRGTGLFLLFADGYDTVSNILQKLGYCENQDFMDGRDLLKPAEGGTPFMNFYLLAYI